MSTKRRRRRYRINPATIPRGSAKPQAKLNEAQVAEMRECFASGDWVLGDLAKVNNISHGAAWAAIYGRSWRHVPGAVPHPKGLALPPDERPLTPVVAAPYRRHRRHPLTQMIRNILLSVLSLTEGRHGR